MNKQPRFSFVGSQRRNSGHRRPRRRDFESLECRLLMAADFREYDGTGNNLDHDEWGAASTQLVRETTIAYADGVSAPNDVGRPNPRAISNAVSAQSGSQENDRGLTGYLFQWGQFIDHDLDLVDVANPKEPYNITVPANDPILNPAIPIPVSRSNYDPATGVNGVPRQQVNEITAFLDASMVYGSDETRAHALRSFWGGELNTSDGNLLPFNTAGIPNGAPPGAPADQFFVAGDVRTNEQLGLITIHTLFVREHNRLAQEIAETDFAGADLSDPAIDEQIYQRARRMVGAQIQVITYREFLPALLGPAAVGNYSGYDSTVNPGIENMFAAAAFRIGHTMLPESLLRVDADGNDLPGGPVSLGSAFFQPQMISQDGIEPYLRGLASQLIQEIDSRIVDGVRNQLFGAQIDLAAINMQRGRDHGLADYNQARIDYGLEPISSFAELTSDPETLAGLQSVYGDIGQLDVWLGGIAEDHVPGSSTGEFVRAALLDQFERARVGDRYYFEHDFSASERDEILNTRLSDIIRRNSADTDVQDEVFRSTDVLAYRAPANTEHGTKLLVRVRNDQVEIVDETSGQVLAAREVGNVSRILVQGSPGNDKITLAASLASRGLPIEVNGWEGDDALVIQGSAFADEFYVDARHVFLNTYSTFYGNVESLSLQAGDGDDRVVIDGGVSPRVAAYGSRGDDELYGGDGGELLYGGYGRDVIYGNGGNDRLDGFDGDDYLHGGRDHDRIYGGRGDDLLIGGHGKDILYGGKGNDIVLGGDHRDVLHAGPGRNILVGGLGSDEVYGGDHQDVLIGGSTEHDANDAALRALLAEWASDRTYEERVHHLHNGGGWNGDARLSSHETVYDDGMYDLLYDLSGGNLAMPMGNDDATLA